MTSVSDADVHDVDYIVTSNEPNAKDSSSITSDNVSPLTTSLFS